MKIRDDINEFGTKITIFKCDFCGEEFSVCPAVSDEKSDQWTGCLSADCISYDMSRDVDAIMFFGAGEMKRR